MWGVVLLNILLLLCNVYISLSFLFWPFHCLSFVLFILTIVLSVLRPFYFNYCIVCPSSFLFWPLYCLSFVLFILTIVLSVLRPFSFDHCIVCPSSFSFWPLYCLSFFFWPLYCLSFFDVRLLIASFIIIMYELYLQRNQISG